MHRDPSVTVCALLILGGLLTTTAPAGAQTSTRLEREVREELRRDRGLRRLEVTTTGSEVTLAGELGTFWLKSEAIRRALRVDGVETVVSDITLPEGSDRNLVDDVSRAVMQYPYYTIFDYLDGRIENGVVTLTGRVTSERNKAAEIFERVAKIRGVQDIQNQIAAITPSSSDDRLRASLARQVFSSVHFERFASYKNPPFHIIVERGVVALVGYVQGEIERRELESIARQTNGVLRVFNQLQTTN
jgi:osmotically-inducible protein OsmY